MNISDLITIKFPKSSRLAKVGALVGAALAMAAVSLLAPSLTPLLSVGRCFGYAVVGALGGAATGALVASLAPQDKHDDLDAPPVKIELKQSMGGVGLTQPLELQESASPAPRTFKHIVNRDQSVVGERGK